MPLNDLVTLSLYFVDSHDTWTCQRVCKLLLCWKQTSWFMLPKDCRALDKVLPDTHTDSAGLPRKTGLAVYLRGLWD